MRAIIATITSMLADKIDGTVSSKRVVTGIAFLLCAMGFVGDMFWKLTVTQFIYDSMMMIVIAGLGFTGLEKFSPSAKSKG